MQFVHTRCLLPWCHRSKQRQRAAVYTEDRAQWLEVSLRERNKADFDFTMTMKYLWNDASSPF